MKHVLQFIINAYRLAISPFLGPNCRFHPTCSAYAHEALEIHGAVKGSWLAIKRIVKCHPYHKGPMLDPVPSRPVKGKSPIDCQ